MKRITMEPFFFLEKSFFERKYDKDATVKTRDSLFESSEEPDVAFALQVPHSNY